MRIRRLAGLSMLLLAVAPAASAAAASPRVHPVKKSARAACIKRETLRIRRKLSPAARRRALRHPTAIRARARKRCPVLSSARAKQPASSSSKSSATTSSSRPSGKTAHRRPPPAPTPTPTPIPPPPTTTTSPSTALKFGINANTIGWGLHAGDEQDRLAPLGVTWLREELDWSQIEPQPGTWDWTNTDALFAAAARRGLHVLPLVATTPAWTGATDEFKVPADPSGFADFVKRSVARYGNGGSFWAAHPELPAVPATTWEVWNEPYIPPFSAGVASPSVYARLFRATAIAGRAADPQAKFLIEADTSGTSDWHEYHPWIDAMYSAVPDLNSYVDGVAVHPYGQNGPDAYTPATSSRWQVRRLEEIRASFVAHGAADKHLWATEFGWTTCPGGTDGCVTEQQQSDFLRRFLELATTTWRPYLDAVFVYHFREWERSRTDPEQWYGLTRADGSHKPAWDVYHSFATAA